MSIGFIGLAGSAVLNAKAPMDERLAGGRVRKGGAK